MATVTIIAGLPPSPSSTLLAPLGGGGGVGATGIVGFPGLNLTLGSLLIGGLLASALWGVTCIQAYRYFSISSEDSNVLKFIVTSLLILDTFDSALTAHILFHYLVSNYSNPLAVAGPPVWSAVLHIAMTTLSSFLIRTLFARRIYHISGGNRHLLLWIMVLTVLDLVTGIFLTAKTFLVGSFFNLTSISWLIYLHFSTSTGSDMGVAFAFCVLLYRSRTGIPRTDSIIKRLMMYSVNTNLIVGLFSLAGLLLFVAMPHNFVFLAPYLLRSKLEFNSLLAGLNARKNVQEPTLPMSRITFIRDLPTPLGDAPQECPILITIEKTQDRTYYQTATTMATTISDGYARRQSTISTASKLAEPR